MLPSKPVAVVEHRAADLRRVVPLPSLDGDEHGNRLATKGDDDPLPRSHALQEAGQVSVSFERFHGFQVVGS
jgi:hypothetical protein